jgi:hypothetical protein
VTYFLLTSIQQITEGSVSPVTQNDNEMVAVADGLKKRGDRERVTEGCYSVIKRPYVRLAITTALAISEHSIAEALADSWGDTYHQTFSPFQVDPWPFGWARHWHHVSHPAHANPHEQGIYSATCVRPVSPVNPFPIRFNDRNTQWLNRL